MQSPQSVRSGQQGREAVVRPLIPAFPAVRRRVRAGLGTALLLALLATVLGASPARAQAGSDSLLAGETLQPGQWISGGSDTLIMQNDGNLVLYARGQTPIWASRTNGHNGAWLSMRADGDLVLAAPGGEPLWTSGTGHHNGAALIMQSDGNAVIYTLASVALWSTNTYKQTYADNQLSEHGWGRNQASQFSCLNNIWTRESGWDTAAGNSRGAYGIPQSDPGSKMASAGSDWLTDPQTQIRWGEDYIQSAYGSPCQAWAYWRSHHSY
ncbi:MAG: hypothetical protein M3Z75_27235 [Actinomycetota bacterium]|nr:hypothetical protein [Actinomycetota bacterium]